MRGGLTVCGSPNDSYLTAALPNYTSRMAVLVDPQFKLPWYTGEARQKQQRAMVSQVAHSAVNR
jgi:hypothetical protein